MLQRSAVKVIDGFHGNRRSIAFAFRIFHLTILQSQVNVHQAWFDCYLSIINYILHLLAFRTSITHITYEVVQHCLIFGTTLIHPQTAIRRVIQCDCICCSATIASTLKRFGHANWAFRQVHACWRLEIGIRQTAVVDFVIRRMSCESYKICTNVSEFAIKVFKTKRIYDAQVNWISIQNESDGQMTKMVLR